MESKKKIVLAIVIACVVVTSGMVYIIGTSAPKGGYDVTVTDALGRNVNLTHSPTRIVSCAPEITEVVSSLGAGDKLVGVTDYCDYPSDIVSRKENGTLKSIGGYWDPVVENIVNLIPDLVLVSSANVNHVELAHQLDGMGITVIALYEGATIDQVYGNVVLLGKALKMESKAVDFVADMAETITLVQSKLNSSQPSLRVLFVLWLDDPLYVVGSGTFVSEVIRLAGGTNAVSVEGYPTIAKDDLIACDPDIILVSGTMALQTPDEILHTLQTDPIWSMTDAVQDGKVYVMMNQGESVFLRQSVRIVEAIQLLAEVLQPTQFGVCLPTVIGNDYQSYLTPLAPSVGNVIGDVVECRSAI